MDEIGGFTPTFPLLFFTMLALLIHGCPVF
jgi:hypothetical protein